MRLLHFFNFSFSGLYLFFILLLFAILLGGALLLRHYFKKLPLAGEEFAPQDEIMVLRSTSGLYTLNVSPEILPAIQAVYLKHSPEEIRTRNVLPDLLLKKNVPSQAQKNAQRLFFEIHYKSNHSKLVSERLIPVKGTCNFRDLGGYQNKQELFVRWGKLYRADKLSSLRKNDFRYLRHLQINLICDFRGPEELKRHPNHFPDSFKPQLLNLPIYDPRRSMSDLLKSLRKATPQSFDGQAYMIEGYRLFSLEFSSQYRPLFDALLKEDQGSILFHCTGGKDRTGLAAALILFALDIPWDIIYRDYLLSNYYRFAENQRHLRLGKLYGIDPKILSPILEVRSIYLDTARKALSEKYGTLDRFLELELGIGREEKKILQQKYLSP